MSAPSFPFRRIVLGLHAAESDRSVRLAAELADLFHLDLLGVFVEDTNLFDLAALPFAREFRPLGGGWHQIDLERLSRELELSARTAERLFTDAAKRLSTTCRFEVVRGSSADTIALRSRHDDIVMVVEPSSPTDRATQRFSVVAQAALRCAAAVLIVPTHVARRSRAIIAIAEHPHDPSIAAGLALAAAMNGDLIVVEAVDRPQAEGARAEVSEHGVRILRRSIERDKLSTSSSIKANLRDWQGSLVVMTRGAFDESVPSLIASALQAPVLLIEPADRGEPDRPGVITASP